MKNIIRLIVVFLVGCTLLLTACETFDENANKGELVLDSLSSPYLNHVDTAGYVGMKTCMLCHQGIHNTFVETGMGKSFEHAHRKKSAADFSHSIIYDKFSDFYYKAFWKKDSMYILEFRLENKDTVYKRIERVDYIIGSGQHTNSHLQSVNGYFNQMPMTFYTQKKQWDLPPGFENGFNTRFSRKIGLECMSCHNSYPDFVLGSENKYRSVPEGITCERCHGPGSIHVKQRSTGKHIDTSKYIDYSIVNPAKLSIERQFDICQRCHLQGNAVLKEGKSFLDFKPGMKLSDYLVVFLPKYKNADDEFIMASHADRLKQSKCYISSFEKNKQQKSALLKPYQNALTCITCHNPHVSVKTASQNQFNKACLSCHTNPQKSILNCTDKQVAQQLLTNSASLVNCVSCHMPRSGSIDIPHVTVHDHYIRKPQKINEKEKVKSFIGLFSINEKNPDSLTKAKAYINQFEKFEQKVVYLDSAKKFLNTSTSYQLLKNCEALIQLYFLEQNYLQIEKFILKAGVNNLLTNRLIKKSFGNEHAWTCYRIAEALVYLGKPNQALAFHKRAVELAPFVPDFKDKLANCYAMIGDVSNAILNFEEVLNEQPKHVNALTNYGYLCLSTGDLKKAELLYEKAFKVNPDYEPLLMNMAGLKNYMGDIQGAVQLLEKIIRKNPKNEQAKFVLNQLKNRLK